MRACIFTNACLANSICTPSQTILLKGKHSHINAKIDNRFPFDTTEITFPQIFQNNRYKTSVFGKLRFDNNPIGIGDFLILPGQSNYIDPRFITNEEDITINGYITDIVTDLALETG